MNRSEHLAWCKQRALEYANEGDLTNAVASMTSDLGKHEDTMASVQPPLMMLGVQFASGGDAAAVRSWIDGFN